MKAKILWIVALSLAVFIAGCSKKEEAPKEEAAAPAAAPATPIDQATVGSISGKVMFAGAKPVEKTIQMDAEPSCKAKHTTPPHSQDVVVNSDGTLQYAFVYVKDGLGNRTFDAPKTPVSLDQNGCIYEPHVVGVQTNQAIDVKNSDPTTHNIHPMPKANREWNESQSPKSADLNKSFAREEIMIPVKCNIHPWMRSYIGVVRHPFFAVTGKDGKYELKGLPPGDYTVAVWQEKYGTQEQKVTVGPKEAKTLDFTVKGE